MSSFYLFVLVPMLAFSLNSSSPSLVFTSDMFIENNYIPSQPSFVRQFFFFSDKLSVSLIILETVLCTCFGLNSLNSSFFGMWFTRVAHKVSKDISAVPSALCPVPLPLFNITCDKTPHSCLPSPQTDALPSSACMSHPPLTTTALHCSISPLFSNLLLIISVLLYGNAHRLCLMSISLKCLHTFFDVSININIAE